MAYSLVVGLALGTSKAGLIDLRAQLLDTVGANVGSAVSTGFVALGQGNYTWFYNAFPDGHRGSVVFYSNALPAITLAGVAINPEEAENTNVKTSTRSSHTPTDVRTDLDANSTKLIAINNKTTNLPTDPASNTQVLTRAASGDQMTLTSGAITAIWDEIIEAGYSARKLLRGMFAVLANLVSGAPFDPLKFRDIANTKDRLVVTHDQNGNRTDVDLDLT